MFKLNIVLCSKEIDTTSDYIFLTDLFANDNYGELNSVINFSFNYGIDGIEFKRESGYDLVSKGF